MFSNSRNQASTVNRPTGNWQGSVNGAFSAHCDVAVGHQSLGKRSVDVDPRDSHSLVPTYTHDVVDTGSGPGSEQSASLARPKRPLPIRPSIAARSASEPPAAIWATLVLSRAMCS